MGEQWSLSDSTLKLVAKILADDRVTAPVSIVWSETFRSLSNVYRITNVDQLPFYLAHAEAAVREAAKEMLQELQRRRSIRWRVRNYGNRLMRTILR